MQRIESESVYEDSEEENQKKYCTKMDWSKEKDLVEFNKFKSIKSVGKVKEVMYEISNHGR